jgi:hypothetical protein
MFKIAVIILSIVLGVCLLPIIIPLITLVFANLFGCSLDDNTACMVAGLNVQEWLYFGVMLHWFGLITLPFAAIAALALLILLAIYLIRRRSS